VTTLAALLDELPDDAATPAVHDGGLTVSRAALRASADDLDAVLRAAGLARGQAVAVMLPTGTDAVAALFGVWRAGGVHVPVNPRLSAPEIARIMETVRPAAVVTDAAGAGRFAGPPVVVPSGRDGLWVAPSTRVVERYAHDPGVALIQSTSGTTGRPKAVLLRHDAILGLMEPVLGKLIGAGSARVARRRAPMPNLIPVSLSLWAGIYNVLFAFRVGAPVVLMDRFEPRAFADAVTRFGIRSTVLPPAALMMLAEDPAIESLAPLRIVRSITAPLSPLRARRFRDRFGVTVLNCYGQTELGGEIVGWNTADARAFGDTKLGAVGRPHQGVVLRVVGPDGDELPCGEPGEVTVRSPAATAAYADGSDVADRLGPDGWFRTGDVGRVDAEGFLWIEGRVSDVINRGGLKVFPAEVEEALSLAPEVVECAVVGVPDDRLGEVPWAFVVATGEVSAHTLGEVCRAHLAPYKVPARFVFVDALPRGEVGKVLTPHLTELALRRVREDAEGRR